RLRRRDVPARQADGALGGGRAEARVPRRQRRRQLPAPRGRPSARAAGRARRGGGGVTGARPWDDVLGDEDRQVFETAGWGKDAGFGERPVLLVVDVIYNFVGDKPEPILESIKRWRYSCGERGWEGVKHLERLIAVAREKHIPIVYTGMDRRPDGFDQGAWNWKSYRSGEATDIKGSLGNEI